MKAAWWEGQRYPVAGLAPQVWRGDHQVREPLPHPPHPGMMARPWDWGRESPGARTLARAILADALGEQAAACPECHGRGLIVFLEAEGRDVPLDDPDAPTDPDPIDVGACTCEDGLRPLPTIDFVLDVITQWADEWMITRREVLAWLVRQWAEPPPWLQGVMDEVRLP